MEGHLGWPRWGAFARRGKRCQVCSRREGSGLPRIIPRRIPRLSRSGVKNSMSGKDPIP